MARIRNVERRRIGLLAYLACACFITALGGCSSLEPAPGNDRLVTEIKRRDAEDRKRHLPENGNKPYPYSLVIAPVQVRLVASEQEAGNGDEQGQPKGEEPAESATEEQAGVPVPDHERFRPAGTQAEAGLLAELPLRFRRPRYRQLLFAPKDPVTGDARLAPASPGAVAEPVRAAQGDDAAAYLCPRCLNPVSATDASCPWCGLAFAPEQPSEEQRAQTPQSPEAGTQSKETQLAGSEQPQTAERYICYFCGSAIKPTDTVCPTCGIVLGLEPGYEGALAGGVVEIEGKERQIGKIGVGAVVRIDQSRAQFGVDPSELQHDLQQVIKDYELFDQVLAVGTDEVDVERIPPDQQIDALLDYAADNYINYLLVPVLKRNEVRFVGTNGWWWGSLTLWVAAWVPSFWVAGETYEADVEMELQLWDVRARTPVAGWETRYRGKRVDRVNQLDRKLNLAWVGWDFLGVPLGMANLTDGGWKKLSEALSPHAFWQMKREMLEKGFYRTFVAQRLPYVPPVDRQNMALLVGVNKLKASETRQLPNLLFPIRDVNTMEQTLRNVTGWDDDPQTAATKTTRDQQQRGRVFAYVPNAPNPERDATLANIRRWLNVDLQTLGPDDAAVLYFSGFGAAIPAARARKLAAGDPEALSAIGARNWRDDYEKYVLMFDTDPDNIPRTALNVKEIIRAVKQCKARRILVIFDCSFARFETSGIARCRTWEPTAIGSREQLAQLSNEFLDEFTQRESPKQCVVFAAAGIQGVAWESPFARPADHGVLTGALLEGIHGQADVEAGDGNGAVELHELQDFVSQRFRQFSTASSLDMSFYVAGDPTRMSLTLKPLPENNPEEQSR